MRIERDLPPFNGDISWHLLPNLLAHVRSRYAHVGLDVEDVGELIYEAFHDNEKGPIQDGPLRVELPVVNHCTRPIEFERDAKPFHLYFRPDSACIRGEELESIVGNKHDKPVHIRGEEGVDWVLIKETISGKGLLTTGIYLRINSSEKYWVPPSNVPIKVSEAGSFQLMRENLFSYVFKRTDDPNYPMPEDALWIGKGPYMRLAHDIFIELDHDAFSVKNGEFEAVGMQTHSSLLEGGRTSHYPHFEIKGNADWVRATVIRNGEVAEQG